MQHKSLVLLLIVAALLAGTASAIKPLPAVIGAGGSKLMAVSFYPLLPIRNLYLNPSYYHLPQTQAFVVSFYLPLVPRIKSQQVSSSSDFKKAVGKLLLGYLGTDKNSIQVVCYFGSKQYTPRFTVSGILSSNNLVIAPQINLYISGEAIKYLAEHRIITCYVNYTNEYVSLSKNYKRFSLSGQVQVIIEFRLHVNGQGLLQYGAESCFYEFRGNEYTGTVCYVLLPNYNTYYVPGANKLKVLAVAFRVFRSNSSKFVALVPALGAMVAAANNTVYIFDNQLPTTGYVGTLLITQCTNGTTRIALLPPSLGGNIEQYTCLAGSGVDKDVQQLFSSAEHVVVEQLSGIPVGGGELPGTLVVYSTLAPTQVVPRLALVVVARPSNGEAGIKVVELTAHGKLTRELQISPGLSSLTAIPGAGDIVSLYEQADTLAANTRLKQGIVNLALGYWSTVLNLDPLVTLHVGKYTYSFAVFRIALGKGSIIPYEVSGLVYTNSPWADALYFSSYRIEQQSILLPTYQTLIYERPATGEYVTGQWDASPAIFIVFSPVPKSGGGEVLPPIYIDASPLKPIYENLIITRLGGNPLVLTLAKVYAIIGTAALLYVYGAKDLVAALQDSDTLFKKYTSLIAAAAKVWNDLLEISRTLAPPSGYKSWVEAAADNLKGVEKHLEEIVSMLKSSENRLREDLEKLEQCTEQLPSPDSLPTEYGKLLAAQLKALAANIPEAVPSLEEYIIGVRQLAATLENLTTALENLKSSKKYRKVFDTIAPVIGIFASLDAVHRMFTASPYYTYKMLLVIRQRGPAYLQAVENAEKVAVAMQAPRTITDMLDTAWVTTDLAERIIYGLAERVLYSEPAVRLIALIGGKIEDSNLALRFYNKLLRLYISLPAFRKFIRMKIFTPEWRLGKLRYETLKRYQVLENDLAASLTFDVKKAYVYTTFERFGLTQRALKELLDAIAEPEKQQIMKLVWPLIELNVYEKLPQRTKLAWQFWYKIFPELQKTVDTEDVKKYILGMEFPASVIAEMKKGNVGKVAEYVVARLLEEFYKFSSSLPKVSKSFFEQDIAIIDDYFGRISSNINTLLDYINKIKNGGTVKKEDILKTFNTILEDLDKLEQRIYSIDEVEKKISAAINMYSAYDELLDYLDKNYNIFVTSTISLSNVLDKQDIGKLRDCLKKVSQVLKNAISYLEKSDEKINDLEKLIKKIEKSEDIIKSLVSAEKDLKDIRIVLKDTKNYLQSIATPIDGLKADIENFIVQNYVNIEQKVLETLVQFGVPKEKLEKFLIKGKDSAIQREFVALQSFLQIYYYIKGGRKLRNSLAECEELLDELKNNNYKVTESLAKDLSELINDIKEDINTYRNSLNAFKARLADDVFESLEHLALTTKGGVSRALYVASSRLLDRYAEVLWQRFGGKIPKDRIIRTIEDALSETLQKFPKGKKVIDDEIAVLDKLMNKLDQLKQQLTPGSTISSQSVQDILQTIDEATEGMKEVSTVTFDNIKTLVTALGKLACGANFYRDLSQTEKEIIDVFIITLRQKFGLPLNYGNLLRGDFLSVMSALADEADTLGGLDRIILAARKYFAPLLEMSYLLRRTDIEAFARFIGCFRCALEFLDRLMPILYIFAGINFIMSGIEYSSYMQATNPENTGYMITYNIESGFCTSPFCPMISPLKSWILHHTYSCYVWSDTVNFVYVAVPPFDVAGGSPLLNPIGKLIWKEEQRIFGIPAHIFREILGILLIAIGIALLAMFTLGIGAAAVIAALNIIATAILGFTYVMPNYPPFSDLGFAITVNVPRIARQAATNVFSHYDNVVKLIKEWAKNNGYPANNLTTEQLLQLFVLHTGKVVYVIKNTNAFYKAACIYLYFGKYENGQCYVLYWLYKALRDFPQLAQIAGTFPVYPAVVDRYQLFDYYPAYTVVVSSMGSVELVRLLEGIWNAIEQGKLHIDFTNLFSQFMEAVENDPALFWKLPQIPVIYELATNGEQKEAEKLAFYTCYSFLTRLPQYYHYYEHTAVLDYLNKFCSALAKAAGKGYANLYQLYITRALAGYEPVFTGLGISPVGYSVGLDRELRKAMFTSGVYITAYNDSLLFTSTLAVPLGYATTPLTNIYLHVEYSKTFGPITLYSIKFNYYPFYISYPLKFYVAILGEEKSYNHTVTIYRLVHALPARVFSVAPAYPGLGYYELAETQYNATLSAIKWLLNHSIKARKNISIIVANTSAYIWFWHAGIYPATLSLIAGYSTKNLEFISKPVFFLNARNFYYIANYSKFEKAFSSRTASYQIQVTIPLGWILFFVGGPFYLLALAYEWLTTWWITSKLIFPAALDTSNINMVLFQKILAPIDSALGTSIFEPESYYYPWTKQSIYFTPERVILVNTSHGWAFLVYKPYIIYSDFQPAPKPAGILQVIDPMYWIFGLGSRIVGQATGINIIDSDAWSTPYSITRYPAPYSAIFSVTVAVKQTQFMHWWHWCRLHYRNCTVMLLADVNL
ncbi:MAG: hypothetical protein GXO42_03050 [bacterium]|nr:hypothetical protein [bacterium]